MRSVFNVTENSYGSTIEESNLNTQKLCPKCSLPKVLLGKGQKVINTSLDFNYVKPCLDLVQL